MRHALFGAAFVALLLSACGQVGADGEAEASAPASDVTVAPAPAAASTALTAPVDTAGAEAFLRQALARYVSPAALQTAELEEEAQPQRGSPAQLASLYTPALAALLTRAYVSETGPGADPLCMCQDDSGMVIRSLTATARPDGRVLATVSLHEGPGVLIYTLEQSRAGWRIAEVVDHGRPGNEADVSLVQTVSSPR